MTKCFVDFFKKPVNDKVLCYFFYKCFILTILGSYRKKSNIGLLQLQAEFWPEGVNKPPQLDRTQPFLVQELMNGSYKIVNGNHRRTLFLSTAGGPTTWPCRIIPKEEVIIKLTLFSF